MQSTRGVDSEPLEREPEDGGLRLRRSRLRGGRDRREERREPESLEVLREADVPVGDDRELEPPRAQGMERLDRAGLGLHHDRAHERVDERRGIEVGVCGLQEDPRALLPQRRQARGVAALECAGAVVGDLRQERRLHDVRLSLDPPLRERPASTGTGSTSRTSVP